MAGAMSRSAVAVAVAAVVVVAAAATRCASRRCRSLGRLTCNLLARPSAQGNPSWQSDPDRCSFSVRRPSISRSCLLADNVQDAYC